MGGPLDAVMEFLNVQRRRQVGLLPAFGDEKVVSIMATSASPGQAPDVAIRRVAGLELAEGGGALQVRLAGALPRVPARGECIALSIAVWSEFRGYQLKSYTLVDPAFAPRLYAVEPDGVRVHAPQVYTVHHTPQTANFFERIPFDEVAAVARRAPFAFVAVGEQANLSPRFVFHHELRDGALELFQGDALWSKTYLNVRRNPREVRLLVDPATGEGFRVEGTLAEFQQADHPVAAKRICDAFASAGLKPPTRLSRLRSDRVLPVAPAS